MCGFCTEGITIRLSDNERLAIMSCAETSACELEMLVQEHDDLKAVESIAIAPAHRTALMCRRAEAAISRGEVLYRPIAVHPILDQWRPDLPSLQTSAAQAASLLKRFVTLWQAESDENTRMALAGLTLPSLFAAICILRKHGSPVDVATGTLPILCMPIWYIPSPEGWELWLQRRAMLAHYDRCGATILLSRYPGTIRPALFIYLALQRRLSAVVQQQLFHRAEDDRGNPDSDELVEMLGR